MSQLETGRISPNFNGNLASELIWQDDVLQGFSQAAGLKTDVVIRDSDKTPQATAVNLGEVLAWRGIANPFDFFGRGATKDKVVEVSNNNGHGQSEIVVNHHILTEQVKKGSERFDKDEYVKRLNSAVGRGLLHVSAQEKAILTASSAGYAGVSLLALGVFGGFSYLMFTGNANHVLEGIVRHPIAPGDSWQSNFDYVTLRIGEGLLGTSMLGHGVHYLITTLMEDQDFMRSHRRYTLTDRYNPFKHMGNFIGGNLYMTRNHDKLVTLAGKP